MTNSIPKMKRVFAMMLAVLTIMSMLTIGASAATSKSVGKLTVNSNGSMGARFGVYSSAANASKRTNPVKTLTTGSNGVATCNLPYGTYYIRQLNAPSGYAVNNNTLTVKINSSNTVVKVTMAKAPTYSTIKFQATNRSTGKALAGAKYNIYKSDGKTLVTSITTDKSGQATARLNAGSYYLKPLQPASGSSFLTSSLTSFRVTAGGTTIIKIAG